MGRLKPSYKAPEVKELAQKYGWKLLATKPNDWGRMISFRTDEYGGVRINIYLTTGTVGTILDHPKRGKNDMWRQGVDTISKLEELFRDPRAHTGSGYRRREQKVKMEQVRKCGYFNKGHCKFTTKCRFTHPEEICAEYARTGACGVKTCSDRHPRVCKWLNTNEGCRWGEICNYLHVSENDGR